MGLLHVRPAKPPTVIKRPLWSKLAKTYRKSGTFPSQCSSNEIQPNAASAASAPLAHDDSLNSLNLPLNEWIERSLSHHILHLFALQHTTISVGPSWNMPKLKHARDRKELWMDILEHSESSALKSLLGLRRLLWLLIVAVKIPFNHIHISYIHQKRYTSQAPEALHWYTSLDFLIQKHPESNSTNKDFHLLRLFSWSPIGGCCVKPVQWEWNEHLRHIAGRRSLKPHCKLPFVRVSTKKHCLSQRSQSFSNAACCTWQVYSRWIVEHFEKCLVFSNNCWVFLCPWICSKKKMSLNRKYSLHCTGTKCWKGWIASWPVPTFSEHDDSTFPACNKHKESLCAKNQSSNFILDFWEQVCDHLQGISEFILLTNNGLSFPGIYFGQRWTKHTEIPNSIQNQNT